jgi:hypothetical protein
MNKIGKDRLLDVRNHQVGKQIKKETRKERKKRKEVETILARLWQASIGK